MTGFERLQRGKKPFVAFLIEVGIGKPAADCGETVCAPCRQEKSLAETLRRLIDDLRSRIDKLR